MNLDNPALDVMTDFRRLTAFIATPGDTIKQAEERMVRRKVRLLFVMDSEDRVAGLITSTDIHGEKPMQVVQSRGIRRDEVLVADIMTPVDRLEAVDFDDIAHARVGHVLETLKARGRQHALVIENVNGQQMVRGLLSLSQLSKQLGRHSSNHRGGHTPSLKSSSTWLTLSLRAACPLLQAGRCAACCDAANTPEFACAAQGVFQAAHAIPRIKQGFPARRLVLKSLTSGCAARTGGARLQKPIQA